MPYSEYSVYFPGLFRVQSGFFPMRERIRNIISCPDAPLSEAVLRDMLVDVVNSWVNQIMSSWPLDTKRVQRMLGFLLDCWEEFESAPEGLEVATSVLGDQSKTVSSPPEWKVNTSLARVFESSQVQPYWEGRYNYLLDVTEFDTAIQLRWAASPDTLISKELLTSSEALPVVHNNYGPVISLMAGLGPIFCPKCEADEEREKIVSMVLSDEDVEIFCEGMRDVEGLGVDLEIEQEERAVFGVGEAEDSDWNQPKDEEDNGYYIPTVEDIPPNFAWDNANVYKVPSGAQQADVCCNLLFPGGCSCSVCADIKDMVGTNAQFVLEDIAGREVMDGWLVLEDPSVSQPMGSPAQAVSPQIVSTPEARSPVLVVLWLLKERLWRGGLLFCLLLRFWRASRMVGSGLIGLKVAEMVVLVFPRAVKPPSSTGSGTLKGGKGIGRGGKKKFLCLFCLLLIFF
ncbi:hypothetical protein BDZ91DRAFT_769117 [Kalaharituber pfeilii]|nr:hypothetical protein BDZ91DRAFT_769117 [Kalaharituber pfeilii]